MAELAQMPRAPLSNLSHCLEVYPVPPDRSRDAGSTRICSFLVSPCVPVADKPQKVAVSQRSPRSGAQGADSLCRFSSFKKSQADGPLK